jgi:D-sedoheptulose 7-phosphate isomerase
MKENLRKSCSVAVQAITEFFQNEYNVARIVQASELVAACFKNGNKVVICGNGGSACDAMHFAEEFTGRFRKDRKALPVISLTDPSHITCVGNDYGFEEVFARGVEAYGKPGDILVGISTSGNSENVIKAVEKAKNQELKVVAMLGKDGGKLAGIADLEFIVKAETTDRIQEVHMTILHLVIEGVERVLFPSNY